MSLAVCLVLHCLAVLVQCILNNLLLLYCFLLPAGVVLTPCVLYWLWPPAITSTPHAPAAARARLQEMGPLSADEGVMIGAVTLAVGLWVGDTAPVTRWLVTLWLVTLWLATLHE